MGFRGPLELPRIRPLDARIADEAWLAWVDQGSIIQPRVARGLAWIDPGEVAGLVTPPGPGSSWRGDAWRGRWIAEQATASVDRERIEQEPSATIARNWARVDATGRRLIVDGSLVVECRRFFARLDSDMERPAENRGFRLAVRRRIGWRGPCARADRASGSIEMAISRRRLGLEPALRVASQTRKTVRFHGEHAWTGDGSIPLCAVSPRYLFRGLISIEAPLALRCRVKTVGLRRLDVSALNQPQTEPDQDILEFGREERNPSRDRNSYSFAYDRPGSRLVLETEPLARLHPAGIIREAVLTTTVDPNGPLLDRLRCWFTRGTRRRWTWSCPLSSRFCAIRRDGVDVAVIRSGSSVSIPLTRSSQGSKSSTILIDYLVENASVGDGSQMRPDVLMLALPCLSFVWEVTAPGGWKAADHGPGWITSDRESAGLWPTAALGLWKPAWDFFRRGSRLEDEELFRALDAQLADSVSAELTFAEVFSRWDSGPRAVVIDRVSLNSSGVGPCSPCVPSRAQAQGRHVSLDDPRATRIDGRSVPGCSDDHGCS